MKDQHFVTCAQMKDLERLADESGLSYYQMMENAGSGAAAIIAKALPAGSVVAVLCGKGNNGGDGFVVARCLAQAGHNVEVVLVEGQPVTEDAITNFGILKEMGVKITESMEVRPSLIVDAIYGTGFKGQLRDHGREVTTMINKLGAEGVKVIALDIPSGMGGDMEDLSQMDKDAVKADMTITFHAMKPVHIKEFSQANCGEIIVADIGIDEEKLWS